MAEMRATPQNPLIAKIVSALAQVCENMGLGLDGGAVGQAVLGQSPEMLEDLSYGGSPLTGSGMTTGLDPRMLDLLGPLGALGAARGTAVGGVKAAARANPFPLASAPKSSNYAVGSVRHNDIDLRRLENQSNELMFEVDRTVGKIRDASGEAFQRQAGFENLSDPESSIQPIMESIGSLPPDRQAVVQALYEHYLRTKDAQSNLLGGLQRRSYGPNSPDFNKDAIVR